MKEGNRMKPSADTSLNWYFYILYSAFIWGYVVAVSYTHLTLPTNSRV